jgi:hypothetical protein
VIRSFRKDSRKKPARLEDVELVGSDGKHGSRTAIRAAQILLQLNAGYIIPTATQKRRIIVAFAKKDRVVYGKAYDIVKVRRGVVVDFDNQDSVERSLNALTLYEIKSTRRDNVGPTLKGYFFAITTAELLVAQSLKKQFQFVFVNVHTGDHQELTLRQVLARARGFYPQWSISF